MYFRLDNMADYYERDTYGFFDMIGDVGGIFGVVTAICSMFVSFFANKMYFASIMWSVYQIKQYVHDSLGLGRQAQKIKQMRNAVCDATMTDLQDTNFMH